MTEDELFQQIKDYYDQQRWVDAIRVCKELTKKYPSDENFKIMGQIYLNKPDLENAIKCFRLAPKDNVVHLYLYNIYQCIGDFNAAKEEEKELARRGFKDDLNDLFKEKIKIAYFHTDDGQKYLRDNPDSSYAKYLTKK